ncbi:MAG TPA: hypothetical protein VF277_08120 [Steroidobacteraceae bacterium]
MVLCTPMACAVAAAGDAASCTTIAEDAARLSCYDAAFGMPRATSRPRQASASEAASPATATAAATSTTAGAENFGLSQERVAASQGEATTITAKVVSVASIAEPGRWSVTLDNGQVWEQRETTNSSLRPRPGATVTIRKASLGSYLLSMPNRGTSRVRRVK